MITKTEKPGRYISIFLWLLHLKQINCPNLMSWLNIYLSEIFGNGCKRRTRSCNWIQWGPVTINIWLIIVRRHGGLCLLAQILCKSVVWYGAPNVSKYRGLSRANCILFVIFSDILTFLTTKQEPVPERWCIRP